MIPSLPLVSDLLRRPLQSAYPVRPLGDYPVADAIVVLGGSAVGRHAPRVESDEPAGARLQAAARLFHLGKAKRIIVAGGIPYQDGGGRHRNEADDMVEVLGYFGVPATAVVREEKSRTTRENARYTAELLRERGWTTVLLVTSASHLWRAAALFSRQNVAFTPVPTAVEAYHDSWGLWPDAGALNGTTSALHEYVGYFVDCVLR